MACGSGRGTAGKAAGLRVEQKQRDSTVASHVLELRNDLVKRQPVDQGEAEQGRQHVRESSSSRGTALWPAIYIIKLHNDLVK
jgi:hypothetical protein